MTTPTKFSLKDLGQILAGFFQGVKGDPGQQQSSGVTPELRPGLRIEYRDASGRTCCGVIQEVFEDEVLVNDDIGMDVLIPKSKISQDVLRGDKAGERLPPKPTAFAR